MRVSAIVVVGIAGMGVGQALGADEAARAARAKDMQAAREALQAELAAHGGTFETWAEELKPYREDLQFVGKFPVRGGLQFQSQSVRVIRCDDLDALPEGCRPFDAIVRFDRQLKARGIDLIFTLIPSKLCVYPDYVTVAPDKPARIPADRQVALCAKRLYKKLLENDVEIIDLYTAFQKARDATQDKVPYVYQADSHWKNAGCRVAADRIGERLKRYDFVRAALAKGNPFLFKAGSRADGPKTDPDLHIVQETGGKMYADVDNSPVIVTGDSYSLYNFNLGAPAHLSAQVALRVGIPVTLLGGSGVSCQMPLKVAERMRQGDFLKGRRVVVWTFNDKLLPMAPGREGWAKIDLPEAGAPAATHAPATAAGVAATKATVVEVSAPPPKDAPYPHYFLLAYAKDLPGGGDGILHILAMHRRKILPAAALRPGDTIEVRLSPWSEVEKTHGRIQTGLLPSVNLQIQKPHYLAEVPGAPALAAADLNRAGEE